ncbi:unnamed protein product [Cladocopium goreaui]|uniref:Uncharacterized protein n=1 Tax=Cladocopium goreaui TaxID=2562237 RepID=A0A9P1C8T5_9DINO|nr:unnamed protein product [Cladocopium goreaui]
MALKSGVFACLILALCVSCNNVMAEENSGKETEKGGIIIGRGLPIETEKSGVPFLPRSENLEETEKGGIIIPRGLPIETEKGGAGLPRSENLEIILRGLPIETEKSGAPFLPRSENLEIILRGLPIETEKSGAPFLPRSENLEETEKGGIIIPRGLPIETEKSGAPFLPRSENLEETEKGGIIIPRGLPIETEKSGAPFLPRSENLEETEPTEPYFPRSENLGKETEKSRVSRPHCSSTSVQLNDNAGAAQAASCVYDFLRTKASASFTKVRPRKFAMKATVFHEMNRTLVSCSLKARVFASSSGLVVEFRRCSGDGLAFAHIFEQASAHLRLSFSLAPAQAPLLPTPPPVPAGDASAFLQPLVEMVSCGHAPAEAEAAAALAAVVSASTAGILAASLDVQKTLEELCESRAVETAYPAARLASGLVTSSCEHHLASELTFAALRGATADHLDGLVRLELAEAVRAVAQKCAFSPCEAVSVNRHDLQRALEEAFARGVEETSGASLRLREALGTLEVPAMAAMGDGEKTLSEWTLTWHDLVPLRETMDIRMEIGYPMLSLDFLKVFLGARYRGAAFVPKDMQDTLSALRPPSRLTDWQMGRSATSFRASWFLGAAAPQMIGAWPSSHSPLLRAAVPLGGALAGTWHWPKVEMAGEANRKARGFVSRSAIRLSEAPPCGTKCATPTQCTESSSKADIAHKAVGSAGATYGYSKKYAEGWERIFARRKSSEVKEEAP